MIEVREFTCPACGSHRWGTFTMMAGRVAVGSCSGYDEKSGTACRFVWLRRDDDDYMRGTGEFLPDTIGAMPVEAPPARCTGLFDNGHFEASCRAYEGCGRPGCPSPPIPPKGR